jgi:exopolysaccharide biosynthesis polyprenyl glycosylphosphotransferase
MNQRNQLIKYLFFDFLSASLAWGLFYIFRKTIVEPAKFGFAVPLELDTRFFIGVLLIPVCWLVFYFATGYYREVVRKSRLAELWYTFRVSFLGVLVLFFGLLLDDVVEGPIDLYRSFIVLFSLHFVITYIPRLIITSRATKKIHQGKYGFNTLIIGGNDEALGIYREIKEQPLSTGNVIIGFINVNGKVNELEKHIPLLGDLEHLPAVIEKNEIKEVIIAVEYSDHHRIEKILDLLIDNNVIVKAIPGMYEIFTGKVRMTAIMGTPLIELSHQFMPSWQENIKHFIDILASLFALIITLPLTILIVLGVKLSSKGPIFYAQKRVGKGGKPFTIYKFRSMYVNAETNGPELSSIADPRITKFGRFMRKSRLDEIPNFYNVLRGDMSLVGPRPERQFFIDQIVERAPQYLQLLKVRPGITSWGQVKYGYAKNIDEMIRRMKYDLIYLDNMSLYVDIKIMIYTLNTVLKRKGI